MNNCEYDKISVCMASFNGESYISRQISSILNQLRDYDELIISDDGSYDRTIKIIKKFNDKRIKLVTNKKKYSPLEFCKNNFFVTANFQNALKHASGKYIFLSDQDDLWLPNKVAETLKVLKESSCNLIMSTINVIDSDDRIYKKNPPLKKISFVKALYNSQFLGSTMAFDNHYLKLITPFPKYAVSHDAWIGLLANFQNKLIFIDIPLINYRRHNTNVTKDISNPLWFKLLYRLYYLFSVINRTYCRVNNSE